MTNDETAPTPDTAAASQTAPLSLGGWVVGLVVAAAIGWGALNYLPPQFTLPERLSGGTVANNAELSAEAARVGTENEFKNGMINLAIAGAALGLFPGLLAGGSAGGRIARGVLSMLLGAACGVGAIMAATWVRGMVAPEPDAMDIDPPAMWTFVVPYIAMTCILAIPAGLALIGLGDNQKAVAAPLGGLLAGLLTPVLSSFIIPSEKIDVLPPSSVTLSALWLILTVVLIAVLASFTGTKKA